MVREIAISLIEWITLFVTIEVAFRDGKGLLEFRPYAETASGMRKQDKRYSQIAGFRR